MKRISDLVKEEHVVKIIIGMPMSLSGEKTEQTVATSVFAERLANHLSNEKVNVEIDFIDERLTSRMAEAEIIGSVTRRSKRREKGLVDERSAQIILQNYLDREKNLKS
jgi:putative Holliday junction resolvase